MRQTICQLVLNDLVFPDVNNALTQPNGLLAFDGDLSVPRLLAAYRLGIFPWFNDDDPIMWWSPDPRGVLFTKQLRINRSLAKFLKKSPYTVTINCAFSHVISHCANAPFRQQGTWISAAMQQAYHQLHLAGFAHSIEVWQHQQLVGGLYGVGINSLFAGESMFYLKPNASKIALVSLTGLLAEQGVKFIDCQLQNPFLASMGAVEISRHEFIQHKNNALQLVLPTDFWQARTLASEIII
jgi:leucyl/phenylalanyl-tRNA---protein transferase